MYVLPADRPQLVMKLQKLMVSLAPLIMLSLLPQELQAANPVNVTGSTDFAEIYGRLVGWIKGDLGRTLSISFVLIGLAYGMARNSLIGFATGVGAAVGLQVTPTIINSIFGL
ncbi:TraA family conjugative transfer protein [Endozoicomonas sp. 2B-B]